MSDFNSRFLSYSYDGPLEGPSDAVVYASLTQLDINLSCAINPGMVNCIGEVDENGMTDTTPILTSR